MDLGSIRIGQGYDIHALIKDHSLILGGINIPCIYGLQGHSDGDVLLHAITDALLGAAGLGDIGGHFPDSDDKYKDLDSSFFLKDSMRKVRDSGFELLNIDATICIEYPKIMPYITSIRTTIAKNLHVKTNQINIKAKTNEGFGHIGRKESAVAMAAVLLWEKHPK